MEKLNLHVSLTKDKLRRGNENEEGQFIVSPTVQQVNEWQVLTESEETGEREDFRMYSGTSY